MEVRKDLAYEAESQVSFEIDNEALKAFESAIETEVTAGESVYEQFSELAQTTAYAHKAYKAIKEVNGLASYMKLGFVQSDIRLTYNVASYRGYVSPHIEVDRARQGHGRDFERAATEYGLPFYFAAHVVDGARTPYATLEEVEGLTYRTVAAKTFLNVYMGRAGNAADLAEFRKQIYIATLPECIKQVYKELPYGYTQGRKQPMSIVQRGVMAYIRQHPEDAEEAFRYYEKKAAALIEDNVIHHDIFATSLPVDNFGRVQVGSIRLQYEEPQFVEQIKKRQQLREPKRAAEAIVQLGFGTLKSNEETVRTIDLLQDMMLTSPPVGKAKLMQGGLDLFMNYLRFAEDFSPRAASLTQLLTKVQETRNLSFTDINKLANAVSGRLVQVVENAAADIAELPNEDEDEVPVPDVDSTIRVLGIQSVADFPAALERLATFVRQELPVGVLSETTEDILDGMSHAMSLTASVGAERKLNEKVITFADLVMRYPAADAETVRDLAEEMQRGGSEASVHQTYRELRRRGKNHVHFTKWASGKGLLS
ncbi:MAG TPA: hypothetical protein VF401_00885 [Candidatus Saccharimonadales bacterium]